MISSSPAFEVIDSGYCYNVIFVLLPVELEDSHRTTCLEHRVELVCQGHHTLSQILSGTSTLSHDICSTQWFHEGGNIKYCTDIYIDESVGDESVCGVLLTSHSTF